MPIRKRDDVVIRFGGNDSAFQKTVRRVKDTAGGLTKTFSRVGNSIASAFGIGAGIAAGGIAAGIARMTKDLDELGKAAQGLNTTVEELSALQYAITQTSIITENQFNTVLQKMVKHIGKANTGAKESQKIFESLGLSWEYLASLDSDKAFLEIVDAISKIPNAYERASVAQKLFEDRWRDLLPVLESGREKITALMDEQRAMGGPTTEAAEAAADLNDAIGRLNAQMGALANEYGPPVIEFLNYLADRAGLGATTGIGKMRESLRGIDEEIEKIQRQLTKEGRTRKGIMAVNAERAEILRKRIAELGIEYSNLADDIWNAENKITEAQQKSKRSAEIDDKQRQSTAKGGSGKAAPRTVYEDTYAGRSQAMRDFRDGVIDDRQLAGAFGDTAYASLDDGAYGTAGNDSRREDAGGQRMPGSTADTTMAGMRMMGGEIINWFDKNQITLRVGKIDLSGAVVSGADTLESAAQDDADKIGGRSD